MTLEQEAWQQKARWKLLLKPLACYVAFSKALSLSGHLFLPGQHSSLTMPPPGTHLEGCPPEQPGSPMGIQHGSWAWGGVQGQADRLRLCPLPKTRVISFRLGRRLCCALTWRGGKGGGWGLRVCVSARSVLTPSMKGAHCAYSKVHQWKSFHYPAQWKPFLVPRYA